MYIMLKLSLIVDESLEHELLQYEKNFKSEVKRLHDVFEKEGRVYEYLYKNINNLVSYHSKHLVLSEAKRCFSQTKENPIYFSYSSYWSNSSYWFHDDLILELGLSTRRKKLHIPFYKNAHQMKRLCKGKPMNMQLINKQNKWYAAVYLLIEPKLNYYSGVMGIDIGIKVPAVIATDKGKIRFFGNGREIRFRQRQLRSHVKKMQQQKNYKKLYKFNHKLHHVLTDYDHQISKQIVDFAIQEQIGVIKMENLIHINRRFNVHKYENVYLWSYRRLQEFIAYKAELAGIKVLYINPYNTSKKCPMCGEINYPNDRIYQCGCGYHAHRDVTAARNILNTL